jgi:hypothetical protein
MRLVGIDERQPRGHRWYGVFLGLVAMGACGGDTARISDSLDTEEIEETTLTTLDLMEPSDSASNVGADIAEVYVEPVDPVGFREACIANGDCADGWCVPSSEGSVCTHDCTSPCPDGWGCVEVTNAGTDKVEVCVDLAATLCHPCEDDADCNLSGSATRHRCIDRGATGKFCGTVCDPSKRCPEGFSCVDEARAETEGEGYCQPDSGECGCNTLAVDLELETSCYAENDSGRCEGVRRCMGDGLTACSATGPSAEACNGIDDDCDGETDEEVSSGVNCTISNAYGNCPGQLFCVAGEERCVGIEAVAEVCDGLDQTCDGVIDEGFPDFDRDGQADCMDLDDDGDGTVDGEDCAILDASRSKSATELCNGVDDDCDGALDEENAGGCTTWYQDVDGDGRGSPLVPARCLCAAAPQAYYTVQNTEDCDDFDSAVRPGATEVCNGVDDSCNGVTDEGVQAPCGGCVNVCLLKAGVGGDAVFAVTAGNASSVTVDPEGRLRLATGMASGYYRARWSGWPQNGTSWDVLFVDATTPEGSSLSVRWRTAATEAQLATAPFSTAAGPYPPAFFPAYPEVTGKWFEVEVRLTTTSANSPLVSRISVLSSSL